MSMGTPCAIDAATVRLLCPASVCTQQHECLLLFGRKLEPSIETGWRSIIMIHDVEPCIPSCLASGLRAGAGQRQPLGCWLRDEQMLEEFRVSAQSQMPLLLLGSVSMQQKYRGLPLAAPSRCALSAQAVAAAVREPLQQQQKQGQQQARAVQLLLHPDGSSPEAWAAALAAPRQAHAPPPPDPDCSDTGRQGSPASRMACASATVAAALRKQHIVRQVLAAWQRASAPPRPGVTPAAAPALLLGCVADHALGLALAWCLAAQQHRIAHLVASSLGRGVHTLVLPHVAWIMTASPGGIKLHAELTTLLGACSQSLLALAAQLYHQLHALGLLRVACLGAASASSCLGCSAGVAALMDAAWLLLLPLTALYAAAAALLRCQLLWIAAMWHMMRGRARTPKPLLLKGLEAGAAMAFVLPRKLGLLPAAAARATPARSAQQKPPALWGKDSKQADEVLVEQLIVGVLLFTPLAALLPTTAVWYAFYAALHLLAQAVRRAALAAGQLPLAGSSMTYILAHRAIMPDCHPSGDFDVNVLRPTEAAARASLLLPAVRQRLRTVTAYLLHHQPLSYWQVAATHYKQHHAAAPEGGQRGSRRTLSGFVKALALGEALLLWPV